MSTESHVQSVLMDKKDIARALKRLTWEIVERNESLGQVGLVGIYTRGVDLAHRIQRLLHEEEGIEVPVGTIDIALHRDDDTLEPQVGPTSIPFPVKGKVIVLVDDVLYTGRTTRAALDALMDFGRPRAVQLMVLVDRGHRELPIQADYVGRRCKTSISERVKLHLQEIDGEDVALLIPSEDSP